jgi:hypothetical protein
MKAMALTKVGPAEERPLSLIEKPIPRPADNQILVKVSVCWSIGDVYLFLFGKLIGGSLKSEFLVLSF